MPIRGENIGAAFVRLIIDGDKVPREVAAALKDADDEFADSGERQGKIHAQALKKGMSDKKITRDAAETFTRNLRNRMDAGMTLIGEENGRSFFNTFRRSVIAEMGDGRLADQMIANFERDFARSGFDTDFTQLFGLDEDGLRANAAATKEWSSRIQEATKSLQDQDKQLERDVDLLGKRLKTMRAETERVTSGQLREFEHLGDAINVTKIEVVEMDRELVRLRNNLSPETYREFTREINDMHRSLSSRTLITYNRNVDRVGTTIGRVFGRGSRSELLNFFGRLAEFGTRTFLGIGSAVLALPQLINRVTSAVGDMVSGFRTAGEGAGIFARLSSGLGAAGISVGALAASSGAAVAAVIALSLAMGALVSLVSAVVAIIGTLVATLAGALVGALGIAAGALLPLVAGIGLTVAAFMSLDEAGKTALKESLEPLTEKFKELGGIAAENIFGSLETGAKALVKAFDTPAVAQFVDQVSIAIGTVIEGFATALASPGFQNFIEILTNTLPEQIVNLGFAAQQFGVGLGGVFLALQPVITDMSIGLANITTRFAEWANSASGQTALTDFFQKAQDALSAIGRLVWNVGEALIEMFNGEAGTIGIEIFNKIADKVQDFVDYLRDPKNKKEIDTFFKEAKQTIDLLSSIFDHVVDSFKTFTSKKNQDDLQALLGWLDKIAAVVETIADVLSNISISGSLSTFLSALPGGAGLAAFLNLPESADGARNFQSGWSWVGEEGPELVKIPGGSNIYSNPESMAMAGGRDVEININNYGPQSSADIKRQIEWNLRYGGVFGPSTVMAG